MNPKSVASAAGGSKPQAVRDRVDVLTFGVGHGDCLLVEVVQEGRTEFRLLYDGGEKLSPELLLHLRDKRRPDAKDLDVVVLSHVDNDHQGGFHDLFNEPDISIGEYWGPCLPAFERLSWLFAERVEKAIKKAAGLEVAAQARGASVIYPMEDHVDRFGRNRAVTVSVISPARRLLKRLYSAKPEVISEMLASSPLPLEWLIRGDDIGEADDDNAGASPFDAGTAMSRQLLPAAPGLASLSKDKVRELAEDRAKKEGLEFAPEFFGNSVLNDTSLVVVLDVVLDGRHRRRIVLAGDQENWSYISSQHPMGLAPDVLKVPHHGGRVYLWDASRPEKEALPSDGIGQFFIWMRPRIAIVSAKGVHGLPRSEFREAVRMVGTTLVCPNKRNREILFAGTDGDIPKSCYEHFGCGASEQTKVLQLSLSAHLEDLNSAACMQGNCHRGAAPVVVMQQRLIEPDETFVRWTTGEVRKQAHWLENFLRSERKTLMDHTGEALVKRLNTPMIDWNRISAEARASGRKEFAANPRPVLRYAVAHGIAWSKKELKWLDESDMVASLSEKEYAELFAWLKRYQGILLQADQWDHHAFARGDWFAVLCAANLEPLMRLSAAKAGLEYEIFVKHVAPRLTRDLVRHFSARAITYTSPHKRQHASEFTKTRSIMLHLYHRKIAIPDFLDKTWKELFCAWKSPLSDDELELVLKQPVLPPFERERKLVGNPFDRFVDDYLGDEIEWDDDGNPCAGALPRVFNEAQWLELWASSAHLASRAPT